MSVTRRAGASGRLSAWAPLLAGAIAALAALAGCAGSGRVRAPEEGATAPAPRPSAAPRREEAAPRPDGWRSARLLRAGLAVGARRVLVSGSTEWELRSQDGSVIARERPGARLRIGRPEGNGPLQVSREEGTALWIGDAADTLLLVPGEGGYSGWGGHWYRGTFRIYASRPEWLTLVNEVDLESYLRSVLPNEIGTPPESDFEAVKAQAVAARSYTLAYLGRRAELGFDLYASVEDQVYAGKTLENRQSDRALEATRGEVLLSEGAPIRALYSSACGGRTANVEDVWPWAWTAYLRSVRDASSPDERPYCVLSSSFRWREEWEADAFLATLRKYGPPEAGASATLGGDLLDVRIRTRSRCGRVRDLAVTTSEGDLIVHGDRVRWALRRPGGSAILRSSFFKIGVVRDGNGRAVRVVATGAGNGHGIGLCQWGAMGMARAGKGYRQILARYYKATELSRVRGL